jgi:hypothetical protein
MTTTMTNMFYIFRLIIIKDIPTFLVKLVYVMVTTIWIAKNRVHQRLLLR